MKLAQRTGGSRCPYCHDDLTAGAAVESCDACGVEHHAECFAELGRCSACPSGGGGGATRVAPPTEKAAEAADLQLDGPVSRVVVGDEVHYVNSLPAHWRAWRMVLCASFLGLAGYFGFHLFDGFSGQLPVANAVGLGILGGLVALLGCALLWPAREERLVLSPEEVRLRFNAFGLPWHPRVRRDAVDSVRVGARVEVRAGWRRLRFGWDLERPQRRQVRDLIAQDLEG